jgi:poly(glycerol-phosphate) alpha-glucosyltransferase
MKHAKNLKEYNMNILMYTDNLDKQNGGVTFALKIRAETLANIGYGVHIVTHGFSLNPQLSTDAYTAVNIFDFYSKYKGQSISEESLYYEDEIAYRDLKSKGESYRIFSNGEYRQYRQYESGELKVVDVFSLPWNRIKKYLFKEGKLVKIFYMNHENKPKLAKYINENNCYITSAINPKTWKDTMIYNHTSITELTLFNFKLEFLKTYIAENNFDIVFIDKREDVELFLKIKAYFPNIKLIFVLHNNHYEDYILSRGVHKSLHSLFNNIEKFHRVVVLTKEQRDKIVSEFGHKDKFSIVSNIIEYDDLKSSTKTRKNLISIGRYEAVKNMKEIIEVFDLVCKSLTDVRLDLYGYGKEKNELLELAKGKNIGIHDFVLNPKELMQKSSAFLLLSKYEGQPLVLLECYDAQCPVFAYDVKFGVKEIIINYENGLIIPYRDKVEMAETIIDYIDEEYDFSFNNKCSELFSKKRYISQLTTIFDEE